jgi:hypothetical protein
VNRRLFALTVPFALLACSQAAAATIDVVKTPWCGCCTAWIEHLRSEGLEVRVTETEDLTPVARKLGVPDDLRSCHSASIGGYAIEGHVPAADIKRLLKEKPIAAGLAVPGMPVGSPGMEQGAAKQPYAVILFNRSGKRRVFARH